MQERLHTMLWSRDLSPGGQMKTFWAIKDQCVQLDLNIQLRDNLLPCRLSWRYSRTYT